MRRERDGGDGALVTAPNKGIHLQLGSAGVDGAAWRCPVVVCVCVCVCVRARAREGARGGAALCCSIFSEALFMVDFGWQQFRWSSQLSYPGPRMVF